MKHFLKCKKNSYFLVNSKIENKKKMKKKNFKNIINHQNYGNQNKSLFNSSSNLSKLKQENNKISSNNKNIKNETQKSDNNGMGENIQNNKNEPQNKSIDNNKKPPNIEVDKNPSKVIYDPTDISQCIDNWLKPMIEKSEYYKTEKRNESESSSHPFNSDKSLQKRNPHLGLGAVVHKTETLTQQEIILKNKLMGIKKRENNMILNSKRKEQIKKDSEEDDDSDDAQSRSKRFKKKKTKK